VGIKGTAIDVYTVVGYSRGGYDPHEITSELLPRLSLEQARAALRYYAEYPDEIDLVLAESETETVKARLYRSVGRAGYRRLSGLSALPRAIREAQAKYDEGGEGTDEHD